jgi:ammonia channel protein AmtB
MAADVESLSEVVVVGYGTQKKETVTGSVAFVKGSELVKSPSVNTFNAIAGHMPGVIAVTAAANRVTMLRASASGVPTRWAAMRP